MVRCVLVVGKMVGSCFGIWLKGRSFTVLRLARLFTLFASAPIGTGCVRPRRIVLGYGILRARVLLKI
ncbi:hypothetical protein YC2023_060301 [Brassica napus]|uniref:Uncharacterized protein n=1 Tax=Brassica oleracea TaxID=3712 RepID=A0A3P6EJL8_BRAOL|nr:unnamed protein product [Brassica oleracea]